MHFLPSARLGAMLLMSVAADDATRRPFTINDISMIGTQTLTSNPSRLAKRVLDVDQVR